MKSFIINAARGVSIQKKKYDVTSKLIGREWRMLTDDPSITGKYIFLKDGKLLLSVNGISTYSTWQMATESSLIMDEGIAKFLYKVVHIDCNLIVLNLDGTDNFSFLINEISQSLSYASFEDIQWYLYYHFNIDMLSDEQKQKQKERVEAIRYGNDIRTEVENEGNDDIIYFIALMIAIMVIVVVYCVSVSS